MSIKTNGMYSSSKKKTKHPYLFQYKLLKQDQNKKTIKYNVSCFNITILSSNSGNYGTKLINKNILKELLFLKKSVQAKHNSPIKNKHISVDYSAIYIKLQL